MPRRVLILDSGYRPLGIINWKKAVALAWLDKAEILEEYDDVLRSPSFEMNVPAVIRLRSYIIRKDPVVKFSKKNLYIRDNGMCQYCHKNITYEASTYDHVLPRSKGGKTSWDNIVIACSKCNEKKDARTPEQAHMRHVNPRPPTHQMLLAKMLHSVVSPPQQWHDYI